MKDLKGKIGAFFCELSEIQTDEGKAESGTGYLEGYLAVFNNIDHVDDRIMPGAFAKTLKERIPAGEVPLMVRHFAYGGDVSDSAGIISSAKEDSKGLWIHADYFGDEESQKIRAKINAMRAKNARVGLSVGYRTIRYDISTEDNKTIYNLRELELREGTVTLRPCNELAGVTGSKSDLSRDDLEEMLAASLGVAKSTISEVLSKHISAGNSHDVPTEALEIAGLAEMEAEIAKNRVYLERMKSL